MTTIYFIPRKYIVIFLLLCISCWVNAQTIHHDALNNMFYSSIGVSSPQTSDFARYGNLQVEHYNGLLNLEIPLEGYKDNDFDLPMSLKYISSGFIPSKRPSCVGYNWILRFGGVITRSVMGSPDETKGNSNRYYTEYRKDGLLAAIRNGLYTSANESYLKNFQMPIGMDLGYVGGDTYHDFEPDIFQFNFGRHSGRFIISNNGSPVSLDNNGYKIDISGMTIQEHSYTAVPQASVIRITTPDGYIYQFGGSSSYLEYFLPNAQEVISAYVKTNPRYITAWHLQSITAPNNRKVTFEYVSKLQPTHYDYFSYCWWEMGAGNPSQRKVTIKESTYTPILSRVQIDNGSKIEFTLIQGAPFFRMDDATFVYSGIHHSHNGIRKKEATLSYTTKGNYMFLNKLKIGSEVFALGYNLAFTPPKPTTASLDHWGFWNGGDTVLPDNLYIYCADQIESDKEPSGIHFNAGLLTSITYPTGGISNIYYEPNRYHKYQERSLTSEGLVLMSVSQGRLCGGARVLMVEDIDPLNNQNYHSRIFQYRKPTEASNMGSGVIGIKPKYRTTEIWYGEKRQNDVSCNSLGRNENIGEHHIGYSDVTERYSDNSYIHYHFSSNVDIPNKSTGTTYRLYRGGYYGIQSSSDLVIREKGDIYRTNNLAHFRGKLLEKNCYNASGKEVQSETYSYNLSEAESKYNTSVASLPRGMCSYRIYLTPCMLTQKVITDENGVASSENYQYNGKSILAQVESMQSNGDKQYIKYTYPSDFAYNTLSAAEKSLWDKNMWNKPLTTQKTMRTGSLAEKRIESLSLTYKIENSLPVLSIVKRLDNVVWNTWKEYSKYDIYGNPVHIIENGVLHKVYLWGYKGQYLLAEIDNATYSDVKSAAQIVNLDIDVLASEPEPSAANLSKINQLRNYLLQSQITSYTHQPLIGVLSITDPRGFTTYYEYDDFGRLEESYFQDAENNKCVIESYKYNYCKK